MLNYIRDILKVKSTRVLAVLSIFSIILSITRIVFSNKIFFMFMFWNLFLAFIPWFIASIILYKKYLNKFLLTFLVLLWLLFFPNAPYVLTDILHLGKGYSVPRWFDLILLLSYGFTGMLYGFISLNIIEELMKSVYKIRFTGMISIVLIYISCFGIYLGRFVRFNSWDIFTIPNEIFINVYTRIINPFEHPTAWIFTLLFGTLLNIIYWSYKNFNRNSN
jgi:uncharacterized membrane protein